MAEKDSIKGGTSDENAVITREILTGKEQGPKRDIVLLNAGSALYTIGAAKDMKEGIEMARRSIDSGSAIEKLNQFIEFTNRY